MCDDLGQCRSGSPQTPPAKAGNLGAASRRRVRSDPMRLLCGHPTHEPPLHFGSPIRLARFSFFVCVMRKRARQGCGRTAEGVMLPAGADSPCPSAIMWPWPRRRGLGHGEGCIALAHSPCFVARARRCCYCCVVGIATQPDESMSRLGRNDLSLFLQPRSHYPWVSLQRLPT